MKRVMMIVGVTAVMIVGAGASSFGGSFGVVWVGPQDLTMQYGSPAMVSSYFTVVGSETPLVRVSLSNIPGLTASRPGSLWISWSPTEEIHSMEGPLGSYDYYIKDPFMWAPPGGYYQVTTRIEQVHPVGMVKIVVVGQTRIHLTDVPPDNQPPVTQLTVDGKLETDGTYSSDVTMSLSSSDDFSGLSQTYWRLGSSGTWTAGDAATFDTAGTRHVEWYGVDRAGNAEAVQSHDFVLERDIVPISLRDSGQRLGSELNSANRNLVLSDLDLDGDLDLVVCNLGGANPERAGTRVYFNDGRGFFTDSGVRIDTNPSCLVTMDWVSAGDLNGDGFPDLVISDYIYRDQIYAFYNDGTGHFYTNLGEPGPGLGKELASIHGLTQVRDLDGDGDNDILVADGYSGSKKDITEYRYLINNGDGTFTLQAAPHGTSADFFFDEPLGDVDLDGDLDQLRTDQGWWEANVGAGYHATTEYANGIRLEGSRYVLGDLDGDGDLDVVTAVSAPNYWEPGGAVHVYFNDAAQLVIPEPAGLGLIGLALLAVRKRRVA